MLKKKKKANDPQCIFTKHLHCVTNFLRLWKVYQIFFLVSLPFHLLCPPRSALFSLPPSQASRPSSNASVKHSSSYSTGLRFYISYHTYRTHVSLPRTGDKHQLTGRSQVACVSTPSMEAGTELAFNRCLLVS